MAGMSSTCANIVSKSVSVEFGRLVRPERRTAGDEEGEGGVDVPMGVGGAGIASCGRDGVGGVGCSVGSSLIYCVGSGVGMKA